MRTPSLPADPLVGRHKLRDRAAHWCWRARRASAIDAVSNSWWGPGVPQSAEGEWLEARFRDPVRLLDIGITPGQSARGDTLTKSALPHRVEVRITTDDGKTTTRELNLDQGVGFQHCPFRAENVTVVRLTIRSAYGADAKKQVAIAEIEFFGPSNATR